MQKMELTHQRLPAGRESFHALYYKDGVHPSALGTYLESCVMSSVISGEECALCSCYTTLLRVKSPVTGTMGHSLFLASLLSGKDRAILYRSGHSFEFVVVRCMLT